MHSAASIAVGNRNVTHPAWLVWGLKDALVDVDEAAAETEYRKLGFAFTGDRIDDGMRQMLLHQQEVLCEKRYDQLYVSYALVLSDSESAKLKVGGKLSVRFRVSAVRIFEGAIEIRGVATGMPSEKAKNK